MRNIIVVNKTSDLPNENPEFEIVDAKSFLTSDAFFTNHVRIFNLCNDYRYCTKGYYVSLLAEARGQRPLPSVSTLMDLQSRSVMKILGQQLADQVQRSLKPLKSDTFDLSIYFGQNIAEKYTPLSRQIFNHFRAPLLRAHFYREDDVWHLSKVRLIPLKDVPNQHRSFLFQAMTNYFRKGSASSRPKKNHKFDLAILVNPEEPHPPSDSRAIKSFMKAAEHFRMYPEIIGPKDIALLPRFDALFIRETTSVNNHTFQFARGGEADGLVVIDDSSSILKCCNKIYLHDALRRRGLPTPKTIIITKDFPLESLPLDYPVVIKKPDSSFSMGVKKAQSLEELRTISREFFQKTDLLIVQEFLTTDYDWRVGLIDGEPLYVCRYHMAKNHWQIIKHGDHGEEQEGVVETLPLGDAPKGLLKLAQSAANLIGDGLYGVDIKEVQGNFCIIEVNDNPSIEKGYEDTVLKENLYMQIMASFARRLESQ